MKLIIEKLDILNLFKKIYKEDTIEEQKVKLIEMSEVCKSDLTYINNKTKQT